jgi:hypothetical protein
MISLITQTDETAIDSFTATVGPVPSVPLAFTEGGSMQSFNNYHNFFRKLVKDNRFLKVAFEIDRFSENQDDLVIRWLGAIRDYDRASAMWIRSTHEASIRLSAGIHEQRIGGYEIAVEYCRYGEALKPDIFQNVLWQRKLNGEQCPWQVIPVAIPAIVADIPQSDERLLNIPVFVTSPIDVKIVEDFLKCADKEEYINFKLVDSSKISDSHKTVAPIPFIQTEFIGFAVEQVVAFSRAYATKARLHSEFLVILDKWAAINGTCLLVETRPKYCDLDLTDNDTSTRPWPAIRLLRTSFSSLPLDFANLEVGNQGWNELYDGGIQFGGFRTTGVDE